MKILLTVHQFFPEYTSGTEVLTLSVARELIRQNHEVHILTGFPSEKELNDSERLDEYDYEKIHVYRFHHNYTMLSNQSSVAELSFNNHLAEYFFAQILKNFKPDIIHFFHLNRLGTGLIERATKSGIRVFMTPTDFWSICTTGQLVLSNGNLCSGPDQSSANCVKHVTQNTQKGFIGKFAGIVPTRIFYLIAKVSKKYRSTSPSFLNEINAISLRLETNISRINQLTGILSPNPFMTELLIKYGIKPHLIRQSAFGIDMGDKKTRIRKKQPEKPLVIGFIGTLNQHKGCHILIEAFRTISKEDAILKIYGSGDDFPSYSNMLKQLAAGNNSIEFCGTFPNSKIHSVMFNLDVLVVPSLWYENTPLVIYSAQASGCPVVASELPGISGVIKNKINGLLFETGNTQALTSKLKQLLNNTELLQKLSENSKQPKSTRDYVEELLSLWRDNTSK